MSVYQVRIGTQLWGKGTTALGSQEEDANRDKHTGLEKQAALPPAWAARGSSLLFALLACSQPYSLWDLMQNESVRPLVQKV